MKLRFFFPLGCILFVFSGLMTSCGKPTSKQEPAAIPTEPAVEKPAEKPEANKPAAVPDKAQLEQAAKAIASRTGKADCTTVHSA